MGIALSLLLFFSTFSCWAIVVPSATREEGQQGTAQDITNQIVTSLQPIESQDFQNFQYKSNLGRDLKLPYTQKALWIRLQLENPGSQPIDTLLYFSSSLTGFLELYGLGSDQVLQRTGSSVPFRSRAYAARLPAFQIHLNPQESRTLYIKRVSHHNLSTKIFIGSSEAMMKDEMTAKSVLFFYLGGIACLIVYNLFIGLYAHDWNYYRYAFFATAVASAALNTQGFFDSYIFSDFPISISHFLMSFSSVAVLACLLFAYRFLNIAQILPQSRIGFLILGLSSSVTLIQGLFPIPGGQIFFGPLIDLTIFSVLIFLIACGVLVYKRGYELAQFFLLSWISLAIGVCGWFGMTYDFFEDTPITSHALMFGSMGEMLVLSMGLAYKINILDQEKRKALYEAREKERFHRLVKVLSHDVANAISLFSGYLTRLKRALQNQPEIVTVAKLENALENMKDILDLVRGEEAFNSFRLAVSLRPVNLCETFREVVAFYEDQMARKNLQLKATGPENCMVLADKTALANQVLSNLLSNAIKFSHPNSEITVLVEMASEFTVLKIQDHGVGMQAEDVKRIFFSGEVASRPGTLKEKGSGLGTSLVKDYMSIFNGRIEVDSRHESISENSGTTISLYFPNVAAIK